MKSSILASDDKGNTYISFAAICFLYNQGITSSELALKSITSDNLKLYGWEDELSLFLNNNSIVESLSIIRKDYPEKFDNLHKEILYYVTQLAKEGRPLSDKMFNGYWREYKKVYGQNDDLINFGDAKSHVYFIFDKSNNRVKIGKANKPKERLRQLQTGNPTPLVLLGFVRGNIEYEQSLHAKFKSHNILSEWFDYAGELKEFIERILKIDRDK